MENLISDLLFNGPYHEELQQQTLLLVFFFFYQTTCIILEEFTRQLGIWLQPKRKLILPLDQPLH